MQQTATAVTFAGGSRLSELLADDGERGCARDGVIHGWISVPFSARSEFALAQSLVNTYPVWRPSLPFVLLLRRRSRLPMHVRRVVGAAMLQGANVIYHFHSFQPPQMTGSPPKRAPATSLPATSVGGDAARAARTCPNHRHERSSRWTRRHSPRRRRSGQPRERPVYFSSRFRAE